MNFVIVKTMLDVYNIGALCNMLSGISSIIFVLCYFDVIKALDMQTLLALHNE